ncbi:glutamate--cysteine ligase catalytic subunit-like isoform X2 [Tubulanus polymorphus]|uniref:glutamate--cysteine ligase catalytic subunit-like isoform X2 n=1 Tax=Tubulanus polymorphus TaxID=672921 RepID=UPI003DA54776
MGLLTEGSPLSWAETESKAEHVRKHGIQQFIHLYNKLKDRQNDYLKWGDEVEYSLVKFDHENRTAHLLLEAPRCIETLQIDELNAKQDTKLEALWRPEYASYMVEGTPGEPYGALTACFNVVESSMKSRREAVSRLLDSETGEIALSLTAFPRIGCVNFTYPHCRATPQSGPSRSLFFPTEAINMSHPRFQTLTRNIRERRGKKVAINIPIFKDKNTPSPFVEDLSVYGDTDGSSASAAKPDHIYMDAMGFGMGCSCLQMTFQACNINEARFLYDQLTPLCPILLALSAASPVYRGYLADVDCRWNVIASSVDDRTDEEYGLKPLKQNRFRITKSRYDSIDSYLSPCGDRYNDVELTYNIDYYNDLRSAGVDHLLAQHVAHLFIRDPISLFSEKLNLNDEIDTDHFENIQSTNWQTMRFKPPPPDSPIGWRVEFRPTEVQLTDFENAAYATFIVLLTRVILSFNLNFLIPISKVEENMQKAQRRDAVKQERFYFRKDVQFKSMRNCDLLSNEEKIKCIHSTYREMSINEIINGQENGFPGLIPLIRRYLNDLEVDVDTLCTILQYLKLISQRASGELMTTAGWIRDFIGNHPEYKHDSTVSDRVQYDLLTCCAKVTEGRLVCPKLLGKFATKTNGEVSQAVAKAEHTINNKSITADATRP